MKSKLVAAVVLGTVGAGALPYALGVIGASATTTASTVTVSK